MFLSEFFHEFGFPGKLCVRLVIRIDHKHQECHHTGHYKRFHCWSISSRHRAIGSVLRLHPCNIQKLSNVFLQKCQFYVSTHWMMGKQVRAKPYNLTILYRWTNTTQHNTTYIKTQNISKAWYNSWNHRYILNLF